MAKSIKKPAISASRHATAPSSIPVSDLPPGGEVIIIPRDPCLAAASQMEEMLTAQCKQKHNTMAPDCCCNLKEDERNLVHIHSNADVALLNTGTNSAAIVSSLQDSHWQWSLVNGSNWNDAFVINKPPSRPASWGTSSPTGIADWISNVPSGIPNQNDLSIYFRIRFVLCDNIDPSKFVLNARVLADDQLGALGSSDEIWVNGVLQTGIPSVGFSGLPVPITLASNWKNCINEVVFHVRNTKAVSPRTNWLGFLAQFSTQSIQVQQPCGECECRPLEVPNVKPNFCVTWGDSDCDCFETNDCEVVCITACNCYSNITFEDLTLGPINVLDEFGNPVPLLPDGTPSVMAIPFGPVCFGDLGPCKPNQQSCKSRQIVIKTFGAKPGKYQLSFGTVCYKVCYNHSAKACFEFELCKD